MGLLSSILGNKKDNVRLVSVVEKIENLPYGEFANMSNDLGYYVEKVQGKDDPLRIMAYAYARRMATACLYFQGMVEKDAYDHVLQVFKGFQLTTGQTVEFQEEAAAQAFELIQSYTTVLDKKSLSLILLFAEGRLDKSILDTLIVTYGLNKYLIERRFLNIEGVACALNIIKEILKDDGFNY